MIPFSPPRIDNEIIEEVADTLRSGWITTGPKTKQFEKMITEYCGNKSTLCVNSATAGLELMLLWYGVGEGDEVIVPAYTYSATANVVIHCGAKPVMVDSSNDFNIDVDKIEAAITHRTKVIIPVDIGGWPCNYDRINEIVNSETVKKKFRPKNTIQQKLGRILILSDAAHSFGATYNSARVGIHADITVFSFHAVKNLTTAEGGAIALNFPEPEFNNTDIYNYLCIKSLHGQNKDAFSKIKRGDWKYDVNEAGYKFNMTDIQASFGLVELPRYDSENLKRRKKIFEMYEAVFSQYDWAELPIYKNSSAESSYHIFMLRVKDISEEQRDSIIEEIFDNDVSVNVHFKPLPILSYYSSAGYNINDYPVAYNNFKREITLPVYYDLSNEDVKKVIDSVIVSVNKVLSVVA